LKKDRKTVHASQLTPGGKGSNPKCAREEWQSGGETHTKWVNPVKKKGLGLMKKKHWTAADSQHKKKFTWGTKKKKNIDRKGRNAISSMKMKGKNTT